MTRHFPTPGDEGERIDRVRLLRTENVGPVTFRQLLVRFGGAGAALEALPELARRGGRRASLRLCPPEAAVAELDRITALGGRVLHLGEDAYPEPLAAIEDAPPVLSILGDPALLGRRCLGVVGARNASANGRTLADGLARGLSEAGFVVVSGMARGIDAAAHAGALAGGTVAVLAGGIDNIYPRENATLYEAIREQGAIVSEMPPGTEPLARYFPRRNRIVSGLSLGVVVIEAAERSGSLTTARLALEQGREVFAVPGSPLDPRSRGANRLIRDGALLVETPEHVIEGLGGAAFAPSTRIAEAGEPGFGPFRDAAPADSEIADARDSIVGLLGPSATPIDDLVRLAGFPPAVVRAAILELEIAGRIERQPGNSAILVELRA